MSEPINLGEKLELFTEHWQPKIVAQLNDYDVRIVKVGTPEHESTPTGVAFWENASMAGGPAPVRAYIDDLLPNVLEGRIEPGRVFDRTGTLDEVPDGYRAMSDREVLKFQIAF